MWRCCPLTFVAVAALEAGLAQTGAVVAPPVAPAVRDLAVGGRHVALGAFPPRLTAARPVDVPPVAAAEHRAHACIQHTWAIHSENYSYAERRLSDNVRLKSRDLTQSGFNIARTQPAFVCWWRRKLVLRNLILPAYNGSRLVLSRSSRKICTRWLPRLLTKHMKEKCFNDCKEISERYKIEAYGLNKWHHKGSPTPKKPRLTASAVKVLLTIFWNSKRCILDDHLPKGQTVNSIVYSELLEKKFKAKNSFQKTWFAEQSIETIIKLKFKILIHPPYSPDYSPRVIIIYKRFLRGLTFKTDDEAKNAVHGWLAQHT
ncbi:hypothetical protein LAZ67_13000792 [Cordylochernes scorpioides]|uniref:Transposase n=1 Tax=Cordylochernes scorpioides TaxID=51811 RepID=A0ABY6L3A2_9ARAC|nr:hypothetical protein LAZ67_13000792 [Cordylochernes scorpioides]